MKFSDMSESEKAEVLRNFGEEVANSAIASSSRTATIVADDDIAINACAFAGQRFCIRIVDSIGGWHRMLTAYAFDSMADWDARSQSVCREMAREFNLIHHIE
jgi:hypothetical protein